MFTFVLCYVILASLKTCGLCQRHLTYALFLSFSFFFFLVHWVFLAVCGVFFLVAVSGGYSLVAVHELLFAVVLREKFMYF